MLPASTQMSQMFQFALTINTQLIHHRQLCHPQNRVFSVKNHFGFFRVFFKKKRTPIYRLSRSIFRLFSVRGPNVPRRPHTRPQPRPGTGPGEGPRGAQRLARGPCLCASVCMRARVQIVVALLLPSLLTLPPWQLLDLAALGQSAAGCCQQSSSQQSSMPREPETGGLPRESCVCMQACVRA